MYVQIDGRTDKAFLYRLLRIQNGVIHMSSNCFQSYGSHKVIWYLSFNFFSIPEVPEPCTQHMSRDWNNPVVSLAGRSPRIQVTFKISMYKRLKNYGPETEIIQVTPTWCKPCYGVEERSNLHLYIKGKPENIWGISERWGNFHSLFCLGIWKINFN